MLRWLMLAPAFLLPLAASCNACNSAAENNAPGSAETAMAATAKGVPFDDVVLLEAGWNETCVVVKSGAAYCAGGTRAGYNPEVIMARPMTGAEHTTRLSIGESTCAVQKQGEVVCWGENSNRVLPDGTGKYEPVTIPGLPPISHVIANFSGFFPNWAFPRDDFSVWRWGGWSAPAFVPPSRVEQFEIAEPSQIESSKNFYCSLAKKGKVTCWDLQGDDVEDLRVSIKQMPSFLPSKVVDIALSYPSLEHTQAACALDEDGRAVCWRYVGRDLTVAQPLDHPLAGEHGWKDIAMKDLHACGVERDGSVWCAGRNRYGQLGTLEPQESAKLLQVPGVAGAKAVSVGAEHSCALLSSGAVRCWGNNSIGQCGTAARAERVKPSVMLRYVGGSSAP